jgi:hypothetical protein
MSEPKPSFVGPALKAIACTPNREPDPGVYETEVAQPTRHIRAAQASPGDQTPPLEQMREMLASLVAILRAKRVEEEIRDRVGGVLGAVPHAALLNPVVSIPGSHQAARTI